MKTFSRFGFLATAMVFHLVYIMSIFDIYFVSPIVSGMRLFSVPREAEQRAPADRLVLFVGDGLRADKAFQSFPEPYPKTDADLEPRPLAPFIRNQVLEKATFGVSHTRVPTESRPGHVALIAGLYEDVSAVATGWKMNPVNFDSVFNRSRHTWSWGSPDILPMFEHGAVPGRVDTYMYGAEMEDFSHDGFDLDYWVFDHVKDFFKEAETNPELNKAVREDKVVFFLHLLGIDTTGHTFRPYSPEYLYNIKVVDQGIKEVTELIDKFYGDDRTAYVFTADHGMSDWGSHGDGHPDNTRTPLVVWGSGVNGPELHPGTLAPGHTEFSADWGFDHVRRHDVAQADIAALMAYLIGTEFPANSVGQLPLSYLKADNKAKAEASLVNAQGILEMYRVKEEKKAASEMRFKPFEALSAEGSTPASRLASIRALIDAGKVEEAVEETDALMALALDGLRYYQTYDWLFLRTVVTLGYLGWMAYALTAVVDTFVVKEHISPSRKAGHLTFFSALLVTFYAYFYVSAAPWTYYVYVFYPVMFWEEVFAKRESLVQGGKVLFAHVQGIGAVMALVANIIFYVAVIESLALGYIHREVFTGLFVLGSLWPVAYGLSFLRSNLFLSFGWAFSCLVMSVFTLLPAQKVEDVTLIVAGGVLMALIGLLYLVFQDFVLKDFSSANKRPQANSDVAVGRVLVGAQVGLIILSIIVTRSSALSIQSKNGLPPGNQIVGWLVFIVSFLMPFAYRLDKTTHYMHRLIVIFLTCAPTFVILAISYEGLFYVAFSMLLLAWVRLETNAQNFVAARTPQNGRAKKDEKVGAAVLRALTLSDARVVLFFMILLQSAFFSTGNVASVSSFSLESVARLIPIFDPFSQGALLIVKLMIPFALISANLGVLNKRLGVAPSALFILTMGLCDILTLYFFWVVKDEGSWLEIGSTISHFVIASLLCVFVAALEGVSALFISGMEVEEALAGVPSVTGENGEDTKPRVSANGKSVKRS
ncbi:phosphatidylinositolglycan class N [Emericellopsis atlantica]|uniref:GPI ethanolamine phosphate transferase 1 n=1 Tax=Emericellopsis atlantica TaxID=2614577 RepID=A0A9P8CQX9_9HYPO|nr:phosphatidylinositolglycan class N [Emericellopsis atlantica]KAG9256424.1 phosphatidylinositolglycan class N [Emericellopsis atlantica]